MPLERFNRKPDEATPISLEEVLVSFTNPAADGTPSEQDRINAVNPGWDATDTLRDTVTQINTMEDAARDPKRWERITETTAHTIRRIIVFSGPGTYTEPFKDDRYHRFPWAEGMDRMRSDHAARLGIFLAGKTAGRDFSVFDAREPLNANAKNEGGLREEVQDALRASNIRFVYIGTPQEGAAIRKALKERNAFIPEECVEIIDGPEITNTFDQAHALTALLSGKLQPGDGVVFVSHGPHLVRTMGMLHKTESIPKGVSIFAEPLPSPNREFSIMETRGTAFYEGVGKSKRGITYTILGTE